MGAKVASFVSRNLPSTAKLELARMGAVGSLQRMLVLTHLGVISSRLHFLVVLNLRNPADSDCLAAKPGLSSIYPIGKVR